ncbi:triose-phosphate isomerase [bacterium]|nr:triose-phosphate isomerase [bacterium]
MRTPLLAANWKMNMARRDAKLLVEDLLKEIADVRDRDVAICPPFHLLADVNDIIGSRSNIYLGAQDVYWKDSGAFTGEVSSPMLRDVGCRMVIIGHSERRAMFGETDETCCKKIAAAREHGLIPILCVGESLEQCEAGKTAEVVANQLRGALQGQTFESGNDFVIAYEPIWAIGTGKTDSPENANKTMGILRDTIADMFGERIAQQVRLLYGGSVKPANIAGFMAQRDIDGALVGGASLKADSFSAIVKY